MDPDFADNLQLTQQRVNYRYHIFLVSGQENPNDDHF